MVLSPALREEIEALLKSADVVVFMKGSPERPQDNFSASVCAALDELLDDYQGVDVQERADLREALKEYSSWPTIPQLFVRGEMIGGADIVRQLMQRGELPKVLGVKVREPTRPVLIITKAAEEKMREALSAADEGRTLRFHVGRGFQYELSADEAKQGDHVFSFDGFTLVVDRISARRANNVSIDWATRGKDVGFKITNPNEPPRVRTLTARELRARLDAKDKLFLFDVRTDREIALARIEGARVLDEGADEDILKLPKDTMLVFHCHHGQRSRAAAEHYLSEGYSNVYNLQGGIDAWSREIDPGVPRY